MGKFIEIKHSDIKNKVVKKTKKNGTSLKKKILLCQPKDAKKSVKRKTAKNDSEPKSKISKVENQKVVPKDKSQILLEALCNIPKQNEIISSKFCVTKDPNIEDFRLQLKEDSRSDLFFQDELRSSYENFIYKDFGFHIVDEISLEGLDGITIEAFWKRFLIGLECPLPLNTDLKELIWRHICAKMHITFYQTPEQREILDIYDRFKYLCNEILVVMEAAYELPEIYKFGLVNNPDVQGSCSTFTTRTDISSTVREISLKEAEEKYGMSLVIVASQALRKKALYFEIADPNLELQNVEYCILERIGRSRKLGELTQGNTSIGHYFKMDAKSVFHYKKQLIQNYLLAKQFFYIKSAVTDQNKMGRLLHLNRFFTRIKPKQLLIAEDIVNHMKTKPNYRMEYSELKKLNIANHQAVSRVIKSNEFHKYVKTDCPCPYRLLRPNAPKSEYLRKSYPTEKYIRCLELIDPHVNLAASWYNEEQEDSDEDDESEDVVVNCDKIYNMECFKEAYHHILAKGNVGCTRPDLQKLMAIDNKTARMAIKKLLAKNVIYSKIYDQGKQRYLLYYPKFTQDPNPIHYPENEPPKPKNVLARIKERQKAAKEKLNLPVYNENQIVINDSLIQFPKPIHANLSNIKIPFFINIYSKRRNPQVVYVKAEFINIPKNNVIQLNANFFDKISQSSDINKLLKCINPSIYLPQVTTNFGDIYTNKHDMNYITKLILLKAGFGEIMIDAESITSTSRKRKRPVEVPQLLGNMDKQTSQAGSDKKLLYMGDNPQVVFSEKEDDITIEILMSTQPAAFREEKVYQKQEEVSERVLSRLQNILNVIYQKKIFEDVPRLLKFICDEENKAGYKKKIDRKSLKRLIHTLVQEGYVKVYKLIISNSKITKTQTFICHPSVTHTDSMIQSSYQQLKWKHFIGIQKTTKPNIPAVQKKLEVRIQESPFKQSDVMSSISELRELNREQFRDMKNKYSRYIGMLYGYKPKFLRMRMLHEILHYLIYSYAKDSKPLAKDEVKVLFKGYSIDISQEDLQNIPNIYCKEISWKMFIPPLPYHKGWVDGWALVCDIILRLPVSLICQLHKVPYELPEMITILNHPIKRFYLVKDLPEAIRNAILFKRKYLYDIHETMARLAYIGLLQFGPQKYKEKDQVFVYLNRRGTLLDTTTSEPAYNKVTLKDYRKLAFFFNSLEDVDNYWYNAYAICLNTKLNSKHPGQLITLEDPSYKPDMMKAMKSKTPEEAIEDDNGEIAGDKRGASGFDSSLWSHLMRNWNWSKRTREKQISIDTISLKQERSEKTHNMPYRELHKLGSPFNASKVYLHKTKEKKDVKTKLAPSKKTLLPLKPSRTVQKITRKIIARQQKKERMYYDHIDKKILKRNGAYRRVKWKANEIKTLYLCKVALIFLKPKFSRKQMIPHNVLRDVLHRVCPESKNKTSKAVQRQMKILHNQHPYLENDVDSLMSLKPIARYYSYFVNKILRWKPTLTKMLRIKETQLHAAFIILMSYIVRHPNEVEQALGGSTINFDHLAEENLEYTERNIVDYEEGPIKYQDPKTVEEIDKEILKSVIHSSLEAKNQPGTALQLFKIYQKFPDNVIREAVTDLKNSQAISFKLPTKKDKARWHTPFQLSKVYVFSQSATYSMNTVLETFKVFKDVVENKLLLDFSQETIEAKKYGQMFGLNEFLSFWDKFRLEFFIPQSTVILNPQINDQSELINELALRLQIKMKKAVQENVDNDLETETESNSYRNKTVEPETSHTAKQDGTSTSKSPPISNEPPDTTDDINNDTLDLTIDSGDSKTIDRLKTWVTDCMDMERERRSPSPEFMEIEETCDVERSNVNPQNVQDKDRGVEHMDIGYDDVDKGKQSASKRGCAKVDIPTLEEIKQGMLQDTVEDEPRKIPYITDLSYLLTKEIFPELNTDEKTLELLKNHFITQDAILESVKIDDRDEMEDHFMVNYLQRRLDSQKLWKRLRNEIRIEEPADMSSVIEDIKKEGGNMEDISLMMEIVQFVLERKEFGATGMQIMEHFKNRIHHCSLEFIVKLLVNKRIFLKTGICCLLLVHHEFQRPWITETFSLSQDEEKNLQEKTSNTVLGMKDNIDHYITEKRLINIKVTPWTKVDGSLNEVSFKLWLCNIMSHCLDFPNIPFTKLCEKFSYIKPMDIFYLVEILQEIGCAEMFFYDTDTVDLFSTLESPQERYATMLDDFEKICIAPNNVSMISIGSFFHSCEE